MNTTNAEQILDILDKLEFFQGQRAGRELWSKKPYLVQQEDLQSFCKDIETVRSFILQIVSNK